ncbi:MAG: hypothetical protein WA688_00010 [Thermoplasmata archaeon]
MSDTIRFEEVGGPLVPVAHDVGPSVHTQLLFDTWIGHFGLATAPVRLTRPAEIE